MQLIETLERRRLFATYVVTNTADSGTGSLRQAITDANATALPYNAKIVFDLGDNEVHTIKPLTALPAITVRIDLQGTTDESGNPLIEIDGEEISALAGGLVFNRNTPGNTKPSLVSGLIVNNFAGAQIDIVGSGLTNVFGCRIGTDASGKHSTSGGGVGIFIESDDNQIGLAIPGTAYRNVICGRVNRAGVLVNTGALNNVIRNCRIGTDLNGKYAVGGSTYGVQVAGNGTIIGGTRANEGNLISGCDNGILVTANDCEIIGNRIGTNAAGTAAIPNSHAGINLNAAARTIIGDFTDAGRNLISGSVFDGLLMDTTVGTKFNDNLIGTDVTGTKPIGNGRHGIEILNGNGDEITRGIVAASGRDGILIEASTGITVQQVSIGTNRFLAKGLSSRDNGIEVLNSHDNRFVQDALYFNGLNGMQIIGDTSTGNRIDAMEIFSNEHLGIKLGEDTNEPLPNHAGAATGPNHNQNYPVIATAVTKGQATIVSGTLDAVANTNYTIIFYSSPKADPSGFGEGQRYIGTGNVTTNGSGHGEFSASVSNSFQSELITATAINNTPGATSGDTSEFSAAVEVTGASISGTVFFDANGNGKRDSDEKGLKGRTVFVDEVHSGVFNNDHNPFDVTDASGNYTIFGVVPGATRVRLDAIAGWAQTSPINPAYFDINVTELRAVKGVRFGQERTNIVPLRAVRPANKSLSELFAQKVASVMELLQS